MQVLQGQKMLGLDCSYVVVVKQQLAQLQQAADSATDFCQLVKGQVEPMQAGDLPKGLRQHHQFVCRYVELRQLLQLAETCRKKREPIVGHAERQQSRYEAHLYGCPCKAQAAKVKSRATAHNHVSLEILHNVQCPALNDFRRGGQQLVVVRDYGFETGQETELQGQRRHVVGMEVDLAQLLQRLDVGVQVLNVVPADVKLSYHSH